MKTDVVIPEVVSNFRCYDEDVQELLGTVDIELPNIEYLTETIQGAGIAGEIETIVVGHMKAMSTKISFRNLTHKSFSLLKPDGVNLTIRGALQCTVPSTGKKVHLPLVVRIKGVAKKNGLGKLQAAKPMDSDSELSVTYLKITLDGVEKVEIDQYNFICKIDGVDYLLDVKAILGEV